MHICTSTISRLALVIGASNAPIDELDAAILLGPILHSTSTSRTLSRHCISTLPFCACITRTHKIHTHPCQLTSILKMQHCSSHYYQCLASGPDSATPTHFQWRSSSREIPSPYSYSYQAPSSVLEIQSTHYCQLNLTEAGCSRCSIAEQIDHTTKYQYQLENPPTEAAVGTGCVPQGKGWTIKRREVLIFQFVTIPCRTVQSGFCIEAPRIHGLQDIFIGQGDVRILQEISSHL